MVSRQRLSILLAIGAVVLLLIIGGVWWLRRHNAKWVGSMPMVNRLVATTSTAQIETLSDTDGDGLSDVEEKRLNTDPRRADSDDDGLSDYEETHLFISDPKRASFFFAPPGDVVPLSALNNQEINNSQLQDAVSINVRVGEADSDGDGLTNDQEAQLGTKENIADSDGDGLNDADEVNRYRTDPLRSDTDGDSFADAQEIQNGYNPLGTGKCLTTGCIF